MVLGAGGVMLLLTLSRGGWASGILGATVVVFCWPVWAC